MAINPHRSFGLLFITYILYYLFKVVHRPKVYFHANKLNMRVIQKCKSIQEYYWPLFLFHGPYFQLFFGYIIGKIYTLIFKPSYKREMFSLSDGQKIALDWIYPKAFDTHSIRENVPICIALYGVAGNKESFTIYKPLLSIATKLNYYCVILGRRGHEVDIPLTVPKMTIFGAQNDIHDVLLHMTQKYPQNPLILIGDSAGTGFWVRYLGDLGLCISQTYTQMHNKSSSKLKPKHYKNAERVHKQLLCALMICPGYDTATALLNMNWICKKLVLFLMRKTFISNHKHVLMHHNKDVVKKCSETKCCVELYREFSGSSFCGYRSYDEWLLETNPIETVKYIQVPLLIINARDDPICTNICLDEWKWVFTDKQFCKQAILVETQYGSHSTFLSMFGGFYLDNVICEYLHVVHEIYLNDKHSL